MELVHESLLAVQFGEVVDGHGEGEKPCGHHGPYQGSIETPGLHLVVGLRDGQVGGHRVLAIAARPRPHQVGEPGDRSQGNDRDDEC
ncbi:MAG: hypothetical protein F4176_03185 [Acidimicrobiia bacterium]|nr:hypothetical protein [Acidimicrobiia bacterium]